MSDWKNYYKTHAMREPHAQVVRAVALCVEKEHALDLGAGALVESNYFLESGFKKVTAVDSSERTRTFTQGLDAERFTLTICLFQEFDFEENSYDLINALYSLPFNGPENFEELFENIKTSLKPEGIFVGQLFGVRDGLNVKESKLTFQTREETLELLKGLELIEFEELEDTGTTDTGEIKYWHVFRFIARK